MNPIHPKHIHAQIYRTSYGVSCAAVLEQLHKAVQLLPQRRSDILITHSNPAATQLTAPQVSPRHLGRLKPAVISRPIPVQPSPMTVTEIPHFGRGGKQVGTIKQYSLPNFAPVKGKNVQKH